MKNSGWSRLPAWRHYRQIYDVVRLALRRTDGDGLFLSNPAQRTGSLRLPAGISLLAGLFSCWKGAVQDHEEPRPLQIQKSGSFVLFAWLYGILIGALPFVLAGRLNFIQALFESVSGWTTTGLSVLDVSAGFTDIPVSPRLHAILRRTGVRDGDDVVCCEPAKHEFGAGGRAFGSARSESEPDRAADLPDVYDISGAWHSGVYSGRHECLRQPDPRDVRPVNRWVFHPRAKYRLLSKSVDRIHHGRTDVDRHDELSRHCCF